MLLPFRQLAPSLKNARLVIYEDMNQFPGPDGVDFFNVLAFRGVFFGSPFAQSNRYRRFNTYSEWTEFKAQGVEIARQQGPDGKEEEYYVKKSCYGQSQTHRHTDLLEKYWDQRLLWDARFPKPTKPSITEVYKWLTKSNTINGKNVKVLKNIGTLTALLICGDLIEADVLSMPLADEWGGLIHSLDMGAKAAMVDLGLTRENASKVELSNAFVSLDLAVRQELNEGERAAMRYNVVMLEHALCKIKKLISRHVDLDVIRKEI
jgi:hypothetical protein